MSDDHAVLAISAYIGTYDDYFQTPNIDRLANEGMGFGSIFFTNDICGPSRATILMEKYSNINGYYKKVEGNSIQLSGLSSRHLLLVIYIGPWQ